jgi:nitroreductase
MIETASLLGVDNGPMEGFDPIVVDEVLGLKEKNLKSLTMLALGYRGEDPTALRPKVRRSFDEVIEFI